MKLFAAFCYLLLSTAFSLFEVAMFLLGLVALFKDDFTAVYGFEPAITFILLAIYSHTVSEELWQKMKQLEKEAWDELS